MTTPIQLRPVSRDPRADGYRLQAEAHRIRARALADEARAEELAAQAAESFALAAEPAPGGAGDALLTCREVADELRMSLTFVRDLCRSGRIPVTKLGNRPRIKRSDLEEFKERRAFRRARQA